MPDRRRPGGQAIEEVAHPDRHHKKVRWVGGPDPTFGEFRSNDTSRIDLWTSGWSTDNGDQVMKREVS